MQSCDGARVKVSTEDGTSSLKLDLVLGTAV